MSPLGRKIAARIEQDGPMRLDTFMALCLTDPEHGYYTTHTDPIGLQGDFVTGPEISQMFGELMGLSLASCWAEQGAPNGAILAELGPGRGTLMSDVLRAASKVPGFRDAVSVHFVEASPRLRAEQARKVPDATWHDTPDSLPDGPLFLLANEFFDALPIRQFVRTGGSWRERVISRDASGGLVPDLADPAPMRALAWRLADTAEGDIVELCEPALEITAMLGARIATAGGAALIVDYGGWRSYGDTVQAMSRHEYVDVFSAPGQIDLTAHVDFEALARAAVPARHSRMETQGVFLERLGVTQRAQALAARAEGEAREAIITQHHRLTHPDEMGQLFKVLGLFPEGASPPPGLEP